MSASEAASLNFWSFIYEVVTWLVAAGVIMEGCEIWVRRSSKRKSRRLLSLWESGRFIGPLEETHAETPTPDWARSVGDLGFVILVAALILEPICHHKIEAITGRENRRLTEELKSTTEKAGEAIKQAGTANEAAGKSDEQAAVAEREAAQANERASSNELAAKHLEIQLNETKATLANAQATLLKLQFDADPLNHPVNSVSATVQLMVKEGYWKEASFGYGCSSAELRVSASAPDAWFNMEFRKIELVSDFRPAVNVLLRFNTLIMNENGLSKDSFGRMPAESAASSVARELNNASLTVEGFSPANVNGVKGDVEISLNGKLVKTFKISGDVKNGGGTLTIHR